MDNELPPPPTKSPRAARRDLAAKISARIKLDGDALAVFAPPGVETHAIDRTKFGDLDCGDDIEAALGDLSSEVLALYREIERMSVADDDAWTRFVNLGTCGLCAGSGVVNTVGVRSTKGVECGVRAFCICPSGRAMESISDDPELFKDGRQVVATTEAASRRLRAWTAAAAIVAAADAGDHPLSALQQEAPRVEHEPDGKRRTIGNVPIPVIIETLVDCARAVVARPDYLPRDSHAATMFAVFRRSSHVDGTREHELGVVNPGDLVLVEVPPNCTINDLDAQRAALIRSLADTIGQHWRDQDGVNAYYLDQLAAATEPRDGESMSRLRDAPIDVWGEAEVLQFMRRWLIVDKLEECKDPRHTDLIAGWASASSVVVELLEELRALRVLRDVAARWLASRYPTAAAIHLDGNVEECDRAIVHAILRAPPPPPQRIVEARS